MDWTPSKNSVDEIIKKLKDSDFISIFFLLLDKMSAEIYLEVIGQDRNCMETTLQEIIRMHGQDLLIEIVGTLKKYHLLRLLGKCNHEFKSKVSTLNKLNRLWKFMYQICELITSARDIQCLKKLIPGQSFPNHNFPEIIFVRAYQKGIFTDRNLSKLSAAFKKDRPDISKLLDSYNEFYHIKTPTSSLPCGLAIIFNHENFNSEENTVPDLRRREDSPLDVAALIKLWEKFGFKVIVYKDLTDEEVLREFELLAKQDHSAYDIFVACYMSHGDEGIVYASNSKPIVISQLIDIMANKCPTLIDKPKLFFIQACQGTVIQRGVAQPAFQLTESPLNLCQKNTPLSCDVLQVFSSIPGYASFAPVGKNSWFIESLVHNMEEYGHVLTICDIMLKVTDQISEKQGKVNQVISDCKQTCPYFSTLRRKLQLKLCH